MIVIYFPWLFDTILKDYAGIALFFVILVAYDKTHKNYKELINHEKIHYRQQLELLIIFMPLLYLYFYMRNRWIKKMTHTQSYRMISFEREAYQNEKNYNYLQERKLFAWIKYM